MKMRNEDNPGWYSNQFESFRIDLATQSSYTLFTSLGLTNDCDYIKCTKKNTRAANSN